MLNTSVIEILRTFDKTELKKFDDFLQSPYFNKKTILVKLFKYIKKFSPEFLSDNLNRERIWNYLYPEKEFNYGVMKNLLYDLTQLTERFLAEEIIDNDKYLLGLNLLDNLSSRDLPKIYLSKYKILEDRLFNSEEGGSKYENIAELKWMKYSSFDIMDSPDYEIIYEISNYTIYSYLINIFKLYNNVIAQNFALKNIDKKSLIEKFLIETDLEKIFDFIKMEINSEKDFAILNVYYKMYKAVKNIDNITYYYDYKKTVLKNIYLFEHEEKRNIVACLWTSLSYNKVIRDKLFEFNDLNKIAHKMGIMLDNDGTISIRNYSLGIRIAMLANDKDFLIEFKNKYMHLLRSSAIENMKLYTEAYLCFALKDFRNALESISLIKFDLLTFKSELKNLQIMIYYELNDIESIIYASDSYKHFAAKNKNVSESSEEIIFKFINYVNALCKLKENPDITKLEILKDNILKDSINTKYWLLEKVQELEKNISK